MTLSKWLRVAAVEDGDWSGVTRVEQPETWELRRRVKLLVSELAANGIPVAVACWVLKLARQPQIPMLSASASLTSACSCST